MDFIEQWFWHILIVAVVGFMGWKLGRRAGEHHRHNQVSKLSSTYFRGLNFLLNEQPDKAIELFLHIAELDKETFETQVALGHLFRRRGEIDRAIRLHQALVERKDLSDAQRAQAWVALGEDYMKSGLLDRAETVFKELAALDERAPQALRYLMDIYQSERDWDSAIDNARRYEEVTGQPMGKLVAQLQCERAERYRASGDVAAAQAAISAAYEADPMAVRPGMIAGRMALDAGDDALAIKALERAARHDADYLPEILPQLLPCYDRVGDIAGAKRFLAEMAEHYPGIAPVLALTRLLEREEGVHAARQYLARQLKDRPSVRGEAALIELTLADGEADAVATLHELGRITEQLLVRNPSYRCNQCGFGAKTHHWQCPSCRQWGSIKPLLNHAVT